MSQVLDSDRRASARTQVQIEAMVIAPNRFHALATIVDLSKGGCQIRLARALELPQRLVVEFDGMVYLCDRRWMKGQNAGLQFLDVLSRAQRKGLAGIMSTPRM